MSMRSAKRLKAFQSLLVVRDLQHKRAEIDAQREAAEANRLELKAEEALMAANDTVALWLSSVTANADPNLQQYWAQHAHAQDRNAAQSRREAEDASRRAHDAKTLMSATLAKRDIARTLRRDAFGNLQVATDEARLAAQEDRDLERRRRT